MKITLEVTYELAVVENVVVIVVDILVELIVFPVMAKWMVENDQRPGCRPESR